MLSKKRYSITQNLDRNKFNVGGHRNIHMEVWRGKKTNKRYFVG
jgi:hypothetical protein